MTNKQQEIRAHGEVKNPPQNYVFDAKDRGIKEKDSRQNKKQGEN